MSLLYTRKLLDLEYSSRMSIDWFLVPKIQQRLQVFFQSALRRQKLYHDKIRDGRRIGQWALEENYPISDGLEKMSRLFVLQNHVGSHRVPFHQQ